MPLEDVSHLSSRYLPEPDRAILAAAGQQFAVGGEVDAFQAAAVAFQYAFQLAGPRVPDLDGLVPTAARQELAGRRVGDGQHRAPMSLERSHFRTTGTDK